MKKLLSMILAAVLVITTVLPAADISYAATEKAESSGVTGTISGSTLYIKGSGPMEDYASADNVPWATKRGTASGIKQIVVEEGITHIGDNALSCFSLVESVVIPSTVKSIGYRAFERNTKLKSVTLPASVKTIGERAFLDCSSLTSVTTKGLQGPIPGNAFHACTALKTVTLNEGVTAIEKYGFTYCTSLTSVTLPASVKRVEPDAFDADVAITCKDPKMVKFGKNAYRYLQTVKYDVYQNYEYAYEVLSLVNKERKAAGLSSLKIDPELMKYAMIRAGETAVQFSHMRPNGTSFYTLNGALLHGENAYAYPATPEDAMEGWMNSPGHRANILTSSYQTIGVGCIKHDGKYYWIQLFGREPRTAADTKKSNSTITQTVAMTLDTYYDAPDNNKVKFTPYIDISSTKFDVGKSRTAYVRVSNTANTYSNTKLTNSGTTWSSSNTAVATVSSSGKINAIKPGKATITAKMTHYTLKKTITVSCGDDHSYKQTSLTKATTSKNGSIKYKCSVCGKTKTTTISKIKSTKLSYMSLTYNGKVRKPTVKVTNSNGKTISSKYYTVTYPDGRKKVGSYKVKIKFSGRYTGTVYRTFKINPKKTSISGISGKSKSFKVKWKKVTTQNSGYQIRYSTSSTFKTKYTKTVKVKGYKSSYKTIKGLKADKKYYVKVRTYKIVDGKTYYSAWSAKKTVRTK